MGLRQFLLIVIMEALEKRGKDGITLSYEVKNDIKNNHVLPAKQGKSCFLPFFHLLRPSCGDCSRHVTRPDILTPHKFDHRCVLQKKLIFPVGSHGRTVSLCFSMR